MARSRSLSRWLALGLVALALLLGAAAVLWRDDIMQAGLDPQEPFQTYRPPPAPDYAAPAAWSLRPAHPERLTARDPPVDVFFLSPTTYDGGRDWNAPADDAQADRFFRRAIAPNYAGPFVRVGRIFAPRYRQASLYTQLTLREDAREARRFAYGDAARAFAAFRDGPSAGRPFILVGVEQGGLLAARLLAQEIAPDPATRSRLVTAYLIEAPTPADGLPLPACRRPGQTGCIAAWASVTAGDLQRAADLRDRSLVWSAGGELQNLGARPLTCFNPLLGAVSDQEAPARLNLGAVNATDLEWGARPAFLTRQVQARCVHGLLQVSHPRSSALQRSGSWAERKKVPGFNLFYGDLEADALRRAAAIRRPSPPAASQTAPAAP